MKKISELLVKFSQLLKSGIETRRTIALIINKHTQAGLNEKKIEIHNGIARISASPSAKSEIFMKKSEILSELQKLLGPSAPKELR
ncbi:hypothetical protein A3I25_00390 [Candidatus Nomurabacteria bacterium RIFCSPLOWO2_02_FULL_42_17]|uniref:Uncharacterized protein n=3 Tax=Patescibacteria group TaxID=1783273 RepID=A0A0G0L7F4_9BACT|nr:MAG: hypothetical protein UT12_C0031G0003 [Candidatus Curtissbacteria bacterium GW2011_GWC2_38_9]KKS45292.1 MAG: hypothetical protein UV08_C0004G0013 [Parcubacteria group bacterium GW2011_GWA2_42_18]OGI81855.1 MAG: hypothetical protein A3B93_01995 [Candidatus Nomurabacteria bacterium RIFCSPHIGHO2_02_FULL_42_24]OGI96203.1 MAG: hypothetical protein A3I25_00390 [Candidatus Nomurabacteria bacterium RIFCSPLOWO2_02_FULL_42_17]